MKNKNILQKHILLFLILVLTIINLCACGKKPSVDNGTYSVSVTMSGGTGKAKIDSPTTVVVSDEGIIATIVWSSPYYDYMIVDGTKYLPVNEDGNSVFEIKISGFDQEIEVIADTTAMSKPHEVAYTFSFDSNTLEASDPQKIGSLDLLYAKEYSVDFYENGISLITINDTDEYVLWDYDYNPFSQTHGDAIVIKKGCYDIYVGGSATMDLFLSCKALDMVSFTSTKVEDWSLNEVKTAMETGDIEFVGKYSAPDFEMLIKNGCNLAIENTMIFHTPEIKEQIEKVGIPVLVDYSSYEENPLGRMEWIKLYGLITGHLDDAVSFFDEKNNEINSIEYNSDFPTKKIVFFYMSSNGAAVVRCPGDYITRMIEMAGAEYALNDIPIDEDTNRSTMNMQMESFVDACKDADILIYNSTIDGELTNISDLIAKDSVFSDFDAVQAGNVWCTSQDMYQHSTAIADMIIDFYQINNGEADNMDTLTYMYRLKK